MGIEWLNRLATHHICDVDIYIFTEGITLGETSCTVLDQVEGLQFTKRSKELLDLWTQRDSTMSEADDSLL